MANGKLTVCMTCGKQIAASAPRCPSCGAAQKALVDSPWRMLARMACLLFMIPMFLLAVVMAMRGSIGAAGAYAAGALMFTAPFVVLLIKR